MRFQQRTNSRYANLSGCNLTGVNLCMSNLERADLSHACLNGAQLLGVKMMCANLESASLKGCNFDDPAGSVAVMEGTEEPIACRSKATRFCHSRCEPEERRA